MEADVVKVLVIPSWYPTVENPIAGVFIREQVRALARTEDVAVLHMDASRVHRRPTICVEDGVTVVSTGVRMYRRSSTKVGVLGDAFDFADYALRRYGRAGLSAFDVLRRVWGVPEIIHVQALWPAAIAARAMKRRNAVPYVVTEHSEEYTAASERRLIRTPGMLPLLLRPLARGSSQTIAVSKFLLDRLDELGLAVRPVVIPNVIEVVDPAPWTATDRPKVILHVSGMGPAKNIEGLLRSVDRLRVRRTDFVLRLVGDGEMRPQLQLLSKQLGLDAFVDFVGRVDPGEIGALLARSSFSVVSSTHETFSVTAAESLMSGRPVLATRCGGPEEFIDSSVGRLVDSGVVDALADGLDWMLDHHEDYDPIQLHKYASARFAPEVVARQIVGVYREVLDGR